MLAKNFDTLNTQDQPPVKARAKAAALNALRGRNPNSPLSAAEQQTARLTIQSLLDSEIAQLERELTRLDDAASHETIFLETSELSSRARAFYKEHF